MKDTTKELKKVLEQIEKSKNVIAKERDKLREILGELESTLESFDEGVEGLEAGKREIDNAIDTMSQFV